MNNIKPKLLIFLAAVCVMNSSGMYFRYIRWLMIGAGMWKIEEEFSAPEKRFYAVYSVIIQLICTSLIFSVALDVPGLMKSDPAAAVGNIGIMVFFGTLIIKTLMCQSKPIIGLLRTALQSEFQVVTSVNANVEAIYEFHTKLNNCFITLVVTCLLFMGLCVATLGDIETYRYSKRNSNDTEKSLPLNYWYPFDKNKHYTLVLVDQNIRPTLGGLYTAIVNAFVNSIIIFVRLQLKILQYSFRNFDQLEPDNVKNPTILRILCVKHQELIRYVEGLNNHLKFIIFMEYMISSLTFAAQILQITAGIEPFITSIILSYTIIHLLIFAWSCNEIIVQSTELARALFESNWYNHDTKVKVMAHIMIMRCQKPLSLMIGRFGVMDLDVGVSRLKLAYTYTSVMKSGN